VTAVDSSGDEKTYEVEAVDENEALGRAKKKGLFPTKVTAYASNASHVKQTDDEFDISEDHGPFIYKMVQISPNLQRAGEFESGQTAASEFFEDGVNAMARDGWEFFLMDTFSVKTYQPRGCLWFVWEEKVEIQDYYVITFRKPSH
jgi:hypothetical protein